jgi:alanine-glyoxylate transaminase/serine-glyoxylate transaminase/serine-pyruvate transaminase
VPGRDFTQNPGPTNIPDRVLEAFRRPAVDFDGPEFHAVVDRVWEQLPDLFGGAHVVFVLTSVGHGGWESALVNLLNPGDEFLMAASGRFGHRWGEVAAALGFEPAYTEVDLRRPADPEEIQARLGADTEHRFKGVFVTQTETSTGTVSDIPAIRAAIDAVDHPALLVVDAIGSFGTEPMKMGEWGVDVVVASSQKGLMMPPGLAFCAVSRAALEHSKTVTTPRSHWDWRLRMDHSFIYKRFDGTPPEQHIYALDAALDGWGKEGPWEINALPPHRANAVTCVRTGAIDADELRLLARDRYRVSVGAGMLEMGGRAFRIGHLGDMNEPMILGALGGLELAMQTLGLPHGSGLTPAVESLVSL